METNKELQIIEKETSEVVLTAKAITINTQEDLEQATEITKKIKEANKKVAEYWKPIKNQAKKVHSDICNKEKDNLAPLEEAEKILKSKIIFFITEQEEQKRIKEEEARKLKEAEAFRLLQEAEKLKEEGKQEEAIITEVMAQTVDTAVVKVENSVKKVDGLSFRTIYKAEIIDDTKVPTSINGMIIRPVDLAQINKLLQTSKGQLKIEGIKVVEEKVSSIRS